VGVVAIYLSIQSDPTAGCFGPLRLHDVWAASIHADRRRKIFRCISIACSIRLRDGSSFCGSFGATSAYGIQRSTSAKLFARIVPRLGFSGLVGERRARTREANQREVDQGLDSRIGITLVRLIAFAAVQKSEIGALSGLPNRAGECLLWGVVSTGRRNTCIRSFCWGFNSEG
jgi:hypothetical protein